MDTHDILHAYGKRRFSNLPRNFIMIYIHVCDGREKYHEETTKSTQVLQGNYAYPTSYENNSRLPPISNTQRILIHFHST